MPRFFWIALLLIPGCFAQQPAPAPQEKTAPPPQEKAVPAPPATPPDKPAVAPDDKPAPTIPQLQLDANTAYRKGDYESARQLLLQAWELAQALPANDPVRYDVLKRVASVRAAVGDFADADNYLQMAISWREQNAGPNDPQLVDDVLLSVGYARGRKDFEQALRIMNRVMQMHTRLNMAAGLPDPRSAINIADDFSRVGQIYAELNKIDEAVQVLNFAVSIRVKLLGQYDPSLVYDLDRTAGLQIVKRAYADAEQTFRYALIIRETLYGRTNADLISTVDGLAYAIFGQKRYEDAEPVYKRFLDLWKESVKTETHPMVAIAYDKLATFYADWKHWEEARAAKTKANAIRAYLLAEGYSVEASQRIEEGKLAEALVPYGRALKVLDVPNPIYDEMHDTIENMSKEIDKVLKKPPTAAPPPRKK